jgi:hypothetical protein
MMRLRLRNIVGNTDLCRVSFHVIWPNSLDVTRMAFAGFSFFHAGGNTDLQGFIPRLSSDPVALM